MFVTFKAVLEAFVFMFTNLDLVRITVQKIMDHVKIKMFHGHTCKPSSASGTCCAMDSTTNQKLPYPIECPSLDDLADLAKGEKGMYKALYAQTKAQFTQEMLANPQKLQFLLSPEFIKQHMGRVSAFDPVLWQQSKLHYVSYAVWYNHRANPEYIARKDIDGLSVGTMLKQNTTTVLLSNEVPHPLLEELSNADDDTLSKFNEIRTMASLRLCLHCQFQQLWTLVPLILLLCVVRLTPTETDDKLVNLDVLDDYVVKFPGSTHFLFTFSNVIWFSFYSLGLMFNLSVASYLNRRGTIKSAVLPTSGLSVMQRLVDPSWKSYWAIVRFKIRIGVMAGVVEEVSYRCVYVLTGMLSLACYDWALNSILLLPSVAVSVVQLVLLCGSIGALWHNPAMAARGAVVCSTVVMVLHFGGIGAFGWWLRDCMNVLTFSWCNSLFERDSEHDPLFVLGLIVSTITFCAGHAYQGKDLELSLSEELPDIVVTPTVSFLSLFFAVFTKLYPAFMFAEVMLEQGLLVAMFWHSIHDVVFFLMSQNTAALLQFDFLPSSCSKPLVKHRRGKRFVDHRKTEKQE